ncbi:hypothetical protein LAZ67_8001037 [Cordylochernes scorpioides]|uniref:Transposase n=1 Tax=Cordylochernes scorpioides TaxID=51811 RepID=A0ABY6KPV9_9ARAC|nr:hypothetical protein LAZ67_8001037 [Cordylochernes scorpioides]
MLTVAYGEATLDRSNVYRWYKMFSESREVVNDEERAGRPSTSTTDEKINEVEKMILANRRITVREVAEDLNISIGSCHSIFINDLGMRRVAAKFVPKLLNCDQKQHRMNIANEMLDSVRDDPNLLQRVITGDEAWVYGYDVETKAQSSQWKLPHEPRPKKARQVRSNVKVLLTVFFDCRGVVHHEFLPQGRTVNKEYYLQVMRNLREAILQKRPDLWKNKNWLLHHDNAPAHTSLLVRDFLVKNNTLMMPQPPYSPDLVPCDFFLFPKLKRPMKGRRYATLDEIKTASKEELKKILKNDFLKCFEDWKNRWHNFESTIKSYSHSDKCSIRNKLARSLQKPLSLPSASNSDLKILKRLKNTRSLVITKSDKGSNTVILNQHDYHSKMLTLLQDTDTFLPITPQDRSLILKKFKTSLSLLKKSSSISPEDHKSFISNLSGSAYIYSLPKGLPYGKPIIIYSCRNCYDPYRYLDKPSSPLRHPIMASLRRRRFCICDASRENTILSSLNSYHPDISFTIELEKERAIPFLDVLVIRSYCSFNTSVYYKKDCPPHYTHFNYHCPITHKINIVKPRTKRVYTHCSLPIFRKIENELIISHLTAASFPLSFIKRHSYIPVPRKPPDIYRSICTLPYSYLSVDIARSLKSFGIRIFYNNSPNLLTSLRHPITKSCTPPNVLLSSGAVYSVSCEHCSATYVGETGRTVATRVSEHQSNISNCDSRSLIYQHIADTGHSFDFFHPTVNYLRIHNQHQRLVLESFISKKLNSINRKIGIPDIYGVFLAGIS